MYRPNGRLYHWMRCVFRKLPSSVCRLCILEQKVVRKKCIQKFIFYGNVAEICKIEKFRKKKQEKSRNYENTNNRGYLKTRTIGRLLKNTKNGGKLTKNTNNREVTRNQVKIEKPREAPKIKKKFQKLKEIFKKTPLPHTFRWHQKTLQTKKSKQKKLPKNSSKNRRKKNSRSSTTCSR